MDGEDAGGDGDAHGDEDALRMTAMVVVLVRRQKMTLLTEEQKPSNDEEDLKHWPERIVNTAHLRLDGRSSVKLHTHKKGRHG